MQCNKLIGRFLKKILEAKFLDNFNVNSAAFLHLWIFFYPITFIKK